MPEIGGDFSDGFLSEASPPRLLVELRADGDMGGVMLSKVPAGLPEPMCLPNEELEEEDDFLSVLESTLSDLDSLSDLL